MVQALSGHVVIYPRKELVRPLTGENERVLYILDTSYFDTSEKRVGQRFLQTFAIRILWNKYALGLPGPLVGFVQIF